MLWSQENKDIPDPKVVKTYTIKPGSILDAPKTMMMSGQQFKENFCRYLEEQVLDTDLMMAILPIYNIYRKDGAVRVVSCQYKHFRETHERVIINFIKNNLEHLIHLDTYLAA